MNISCMIVQVSFSFECLVTNIAFVLYFHVGVFVNEFFVSFVANLRFEGNVAFFTLKCFLVHCFDGDPSSKAFNKLICEIENLKNERILKGMYEWRCRTLFK